VKWSRVIQFVAGIAIAAAGLWIFFKDVDLQSLGNRLMNGNPFIYLASMAIAIFTLWIRSIRWRLLLPTPAGTHTKGLFSHVMIGFMINNILPARIGEAVRVLLLWKRNKYPPALSIGSLILERVIDLIVFMSFFFIPSFLLFGRTKFFTISLTLALLAGALVLGFLLFAIAPAFITRIAKLVTVIMPGKIKPKVSVLIDEIILNLNWIFSPMKVLLIVCLSFSIAFTYVLMIWLLAGPDPNLSFLKCMFVQAAAAFGAAIPLSPGYVGTLHAVMLQALETFGMEIEKARALTILFHALSYLPVTIIGLIFFFRTDMTFKDISKADEAIK
jgi:glycosyltransferase 2 family protein